MVAVVLSKFTCVVNSMKNVASTHLTDDEAEAWRV